MLSALGAGRSSRQLKKFEEEIKDLDEEQGGEYMRDSGKEVRSSNPTEAGTRTGHIASNGERARISSKGGTSEYSTETNVAGRYPTLVSDATERSSANMSRPNCRRSAGRSSKPEGC